jgi:hypothetical protein
VFLFFFSSTILDLSFFSVIVFDLQIGKNKDILSNGNKIGVRLFLLFVNIILTNPLGRASLFSLLFTLTSKVPFIQYLVLCRVTIHPEALEHHLTLYKTCFMGPFFNHVL